MTKSNLPLLTTTDVNDVEKARKLFALAAVIRFAYEAFIDHPKQQPKQQLDSSTIEIIPNISSSDKDDIPHGHDNKDIRSETGKKKTYFDRYNIASQKSGLIAVIYFFLCFLFHRPVQTLFHTMGSS